MTDTIASPLAAAAASADDRSLAPTPTKPNAPSARARTAVIELRVRNHPGAMSHIAGLFARRAFNLEAIVCAPVGDGTMSTALLLVREDQRLEQLERQLAKLYDVWSVRHRTDLTPEYFTGLCRV